MDHLGAPNTRRRSACVTLKSRSQRCEKLLEGLEADAPHRTNMSDLGGEQMVREHSWEMLGVGVESADD